MTAIKRVDNECDRNPIEILPASKSPSEGSTERIAKAIVVPDRDLLGSAIEILPASKSPSVGLSDRIATAIEILQVCSSQQ